MFKITEFVEFDQKGRAICPCCAAEGKTNKRNLALIPNTDGAYKCHRGCTPEQIRESLGVPKNKQIPAALASPTRPPATGHQPPGRTPSTTVTPQKVREAHERLMQPAAEKARQWLTDRGITEPMMQRHQLGLTRSRQGERMVPAISIPIPANADGTHYFQKKRIEPWEPEQPEDYSPWVQKGIPAKVWFTWLPAEVTETWLCEGEWDAIMLAWAAREAELPVAVASFTCGCSAVPPDSELALLPGDVIIFYDRNDAPLKNGTIPGEAGAKKLATALKERGKIALVPMPEDCPIKGWDVSNALNAGYTIEDFITAANAAVLVSNEPQKPDNPLREHLQWNDVLLDTAPEYTDWVVPDLLTTNELFLLAAGPRSGKSLLAMTLAKSVATGEPFLGRPVLQGPVIYIRKEDGDSKTKEREMAQGWTRGLPVAWLKKFKLSQLPHLRDLAEEIQPRLIVVDTLSRVKDSDISESSAEMSQLLEPLQEMAEEMDICVLLVHHTSKVSVDNAGVIDIFDTIRGSSAIRATCRGAIVLAAGERNYRLLAENGWGKHDLNVVLDVNTLTWRLLGNWVPTVIGTQSDQIIDYLKTCQIATIDQMHADLGIPKMSLYKTLERLQASEIAGEKVVKEGRKRSYTYRLAIFEAAKTLFDTIGLSNNLSNRPNADTDSDRCPIRQKNDFSLSDSGSIIDQSGTCDSLIDPDDDSPKELVKYRPKTGSKPHGASVSAFRQLFDKPEPITGSNSDGESFSDDAALFDKLFDNPDSLFDKADQTLQIDQLQFPVNLLALTSDGWKIAQGLRESDRMVYSPKSKALERGVYCRLLRTDERQNFPIDHLKLPRRKRHADE